MNSNVPGTEIQAAMLVNGSLFLILKRHSWVIPFIYLFIFHSKSGNLSHTTFVSISTSFSIVIEFKGRNICFNL